MFAALTAGGMNEPIVVVASDPKVTASMSLLLSGLANPKLGSRVANSPRVHLVDSQGTINP